MTGPGSMLMRKVRGVRVVDLVGAACLVAIVLLVYGSKAVAGAEAARIAETSRLIAAEAQEVKLLRAERAYLTQPRRLRDLSVRYLGMGPTPVDHDTTPEALLQLRRSAAPPPPSQPATSPGAPSTPQARL